MAKIAFIGAGSTVFAKHLIGDVLSFPELADSHIALMDIDGERLKTSQVVAEQVNRVLGTKATITATTDRAEAGAWASSLPGLTAERNDRRAKRIR